MTPSLLFERGKFENNSTFRRDIISGRFLTWRAGRLKLALHCFRGLLRDFV